MQVELSHVHQCLSKLKNFSKSVIESKNNKGLLTCPSNNSIQQKVTKVQQILSVKLEQKQRDCVKIK